MRNIILIAPPAAGKGTQAELLEKKYNIPHISTGDLLRNEINHNSKLSKEIKEAIDNGLFVEDKIVIKILDKRIKKEDCNNGYILDGFPRTLNQAQLYYDYLKNNNKTAIAILINLDKEVAKLRINSRLTCSNCGRVYNLNDESLKPNKNNICDCCGSSLTKRKDDNDETYEIRYNEYVEDTEPIINYYKEKNILYIVNGNKDVNSIQNEIINIINQKQ